MSILTKIKIAKYKFFTVRQKDQRVEVLKIYNKSTINFKKITPHNINTYKALPKKEREAYGLYLKPSAYEGVEFRGIFGEPKKETFDSFWRREYPIQFFFRSFLKRKVSVRLMIIGDLKRRFKRLYRHENKVFIDMIPKERVDEMDLFEKFNLGVIERFDRICDKYVNWDDNDKHKEFRKFVAKSAYRVREVLPYIEKRIDIAESNFLKRCGGTSFQESRKHLTFWESAREDLVKSIIIGIAENRQYFWE